MEEKKSIKGFMCIDKTGGKSFSFDYIVANEKSDLKFDSNQLINKNGYSIFDLPQDINGKEVFLCAMCEEIKPLGPTSKESFICDKDSIFMQCMN